jgi:hypothetical protein
MRKRGFDGYRRYSEDNHRTLDAVSDLSRNEYIASIEQKFKLSRYRFLSMGDFAEMVDAALPKPGKRGPYKKRAAWAN